MLLSARAANLNQMDSKEESDFISGFIFFWLLKSFLVLNIQTH